MGFRFRWRWGWDRRLGTFGRLAMWLLLYTLVSQASFVVLTKVATARHSGTYTIYMNSWLLLQVPYGILARVAADRDHAAAVQVRRRRRHGRDQGQPVAGQPA